MDRVYHVYISCAVHRRDERSRTPSLPASGEGRSRIYAEVRCHEADLFRGLGRHSGAIQREKEIKGWRREKKIVLIRGMNPKFRELSEDFHR